MKIKPIDFKDEFYQKLTGLVLPITIQAFMLALVSATDALMLGLVDQTSLSAVSLAAQVQFVLSLFVSGIGGGVAILAAQYWGKGDTATIETFVPIALRANLIFGGSFTLLSAFVPELLMGLFTNEAALITAGAAYLRTVSLSYLFCGISQIYLTVLKNTDLAKISSRISSTAVGLNIILNGLLIFGLCGLPRLGIVGAAAATVIARLVELIWAMLETGKPGRVQVQWNRLLRRVGAIRKDFWHYTLPILTAFMVWGLAFTSYSAIMGHMGSDVVAANSIASIAKSLVSCLIRGVSGGAGILIGNLLGAGLLDKAKQWGARLTHLSIAVGIGTGGLLMLLSPIIVRFTPLSEVSRGYLQGMLLFCGINIAFQSVNTTVLDGIFGAGGDPQFDAITNVFAMWCFSVPLGFLAAFYFKLPALAVYCIVNLDEIVKIPAVYVHYKKYIWVRNITKDHPEA